MRSTIKKPFIIIGAALGVIVLSCLVTLYFVSDSNANLLDLVTGKSKRDFQQVPFDSLDASESCRNESKGQFGQDFLRSTVDWHSTRFQENREVYIVVLDADIGTRENFEQARVYCYVNPKSYIVSYFKAYDSHNDAMLSGGFNLKDMMESFSLDI